MTAGNTVFVAAAAFAAAAAGGGASPQGQKQPTLTGDVVKAMDKACRPCHEGASPAAGFSPFAYKSEAAARADLGTWSRALTAVRSGLMPPGGKMSPAARDSLVSLMSTAIAGEDKPARVTIRRLNRAEYRYTIEDLMGVQFDPGDEFPSDDVGYGFDNIGDVLSMSPLYLESCLKAAEKISAQAILLPGGLNRTIEADKFDIMPERIGLTPGGQVNLFISGAVGSRVAIPAAGRYRIKVTASGQQAGPEPCRMAIRAGGKDLATVEVKGAQDKPATFEAVADLTAGPIPITAVFLNDFYNENDPNPANRDRNLLVWSIEIAGPEGGFAPPPTHLRIIPAPPAPGQEQAMLRKYLSVFAGRAYRRPATAPEVESAVKVASMMLAEKQPFERAMQAGVTAILVSPNFLFRTEPDPAGAKGVRPLSGSEVATRLSYFLWSSTPDDELLSKAASGALSNPEEVKKQVLRMTRDPKIARLGRTFAEQWLQLRKLASISPDRKTYPAYTDALKRDMAAESIMFFDQAVARDESVLDFITGDYSYLNERLAGFYGVTGVTGPDLRKVQFTGGMRGGVLGQGAVLMITSNPNRTSPTKRGKWVLEQILGTPPPPPPPGTPALPEPTAAKPLNLREKLAQHRKDPACGVCHDKIDPLGFSLENFDAIGGWRTEDSFGKIDASGTLPNGSTVNGPAELKKVLGDRKDEFVRALADRMLTFALGRGTEPSDGPALDQITASVRKNGYRMSALLQAVALSRPFLYKTVETKP